MKQLTKEQAIAFGENNCYENMTYRQIGAEDGVSANTVKVRIQQALKLIEQRFSRYFGVLTIFMILV